MTMQTNDDPPHKNFSCSDGKELACYDWVATDGSKNRHIILVHGLGEHAGRYTTIAALWNARGYQVHAIDIRGHGNTAGPRGYAPRWQRLLDDVQEFSQQYGGSKFLVGHSMGGAIAATLLAQQSTLFERAALTNPALNLSLPVPGWQRFAASILSRCLPSIGMANSIDANELTSVPGHADNYLQDPLVHNRVAARFFTEYLQAIDKLGSCGKEITTALAIWHGEDDKIVAPWVSEQFFRTLQCEPKKLNLLAGQKHEILFEQRGTAVAEAIADWFDAA